MSEAAVEASFEHLSITENIENLPEEDSEEEDVGHHVSGLGSHEYWEAAYGQELLNLLVHGDEGEIWFGEETMHAMVDWIDEKLRVERTITRLHGKLEDIKILDVGTGNGVLLVALADKGYQHLWGTDYSAASVRLAANVMERHQLDHQINLVVDDILNSTLAERFNVITDKGTLDAIGLSDNAETARRQYRMSVWRLLAPQGYLVITSCNCTKDELVEEMTAAPQNDHDLIACRFEYADHIKTYPRFKFGGIEGTKVCTVAFRRVENLSHSLLRQ